MYLSFHFRLKLKDYLDCEFDNIILVQSLQILDDSINGSVVP